MAWLPNPGVCTVPMAFSRGSAVSWRLAADGIATDFSHRGYKFLVLDFVVELDRFKDAAVTGAAVTATLSWLASGSGRRLDTLSQWPLLLASAPCIEVGLYFTPFT